MRKLLFALALCLAPTAAFAQNTTCSDRPQSDSSNACANTRFVHGATSTIGPGGANGSVQYNNGGVFGGINPLDVPRGGTGQQTFTPNLPLVGNGTGAVGQGTRSGNTTTFGTTSGTLTSGNCAQFDANGNIVDAGTSCVNLTIVSSITALKAVDTTKYSVVVYNAQNRPAIWRWTLGDFSSQVALDTGGAMFVKANAVSASVGAWLAVSPDHTCHSTWFDAAGNYNSGTGSGTDDTAALQRWLSVCQVASAGGYWTAYLDAGNYKITSSLQNRVYVNITSANERFAVIFPVMSSGPAFLMDGTGGSDAGYHQTIEKISIDGTSATGTAYALSVGGNTKLTTFRNMWFQNFTVAGTYAVQQQGNSYSILYERCHWLNNARHFLALLLSSASFPTNSTMTDNIFEEGTDVSGPALNFNNSSGFIVKNNIFQSNQNLYTIFVTETGSAQTSSDFTFKENELEDNGVGISGSIDLYLYAPAPSVVRFARVFDNRWHGTGPANKIWADGTDWTRIYNNSGGNPATYGIRKTDTNTNYIGTGDGLAGTIDP